MTSRESFETEMYVYYGTNEYNFEVLENPPEYEPTFGSYAYGSPTPDSDVDLMVVMDTDLPSSQRYLAVSRLLDPRPFPVDILVRRPDEIDRAFRAGDFFIRGIMTQGQVLYEREH